MRVRSMLAAVAIAASFAAGAAAPAALAERLPDPGTGGGQPLASGQISGEDAHGVIHCQTAAELFVDPALAPGSAPGGVVITPTGPRLGGPQEGLCAQIYTAFTGQQP